MSFYMKHLNIYQFNKALTFQKLHLTRIRIRARETLKSRFLNTTL